VDGLSSVALVEDVAVTHYGESYNGLKLGCSAETYSSDNASIVAVGPERSAEWPCGTVLRVCGPGGCIVGQRQDGCPGCGSHVIDLSEEGIYLVCGPGSGVCQASVEVIARPVCHGTTGSLVSEAGAGRSLASIQLFAELAETALEDRTADLLDLGSDGHLPAAICTAQSR
jgi:hypothetical protein